MEQDKTDTVIGSQLSLRTLGGLAEPEGTDWSFVRALQLRPIRGNEPIFLALDMVLAVLAAYFLSRHVPLAMALLWLGALAAFDFYCFSYFRRAELWTRKHVTRKDFHAIHFLSLAGGLIWAGAFALLAVYGDSPAVMGLWTIAIVIMVLTATLGSSVPLSALAFLSPITLAAVATFLRFGEPVMALIIGGAIVPLTIAAIRQARSYILQHIAEQTVQEKTETVSLLLREFEDSGADWLWQTDASRCATHVSPRFAFALGLSAEEIDGQPILKLFAGDAWESGQYPASLHELAEKLKRREAFSNLVIPVVRDGKQRWWELSASPRMGEQDNFLGFRGVGSDVSEKRESEEKISHLARFDTLTGLPNRLQLTEALSRAMQDADRWNSRCAFMMIDLDRFKAVNDTLGHPVGDRLLAQVSRRLQSIMSPNELCGRLGGDEFAVVVRDGTDHMKLEALALAIIETLSRPYEIDQHTIFIGASVGTGVGPRDGRTVDMLMRSADLALYRSKDEGGGKHHSYKPQLHAHAEERRLIEIELRKALERKEMFLNYQPVVDAREGGLTGFEALLRWNNATFGNVSPAKFIPLAEEARLINPIGEWVLRQACRDAAHWPEYTKIAVNVSADQLTNPNFVDTVLSALQESGIQPFRLELEVTESLFMRDGGVAVRLLDKLLGLGIKLSLDDFGTGYSSLGYLRKTRFDTIKVDRSFVQGAARNVPESVAIVRAVVAMADSLGMATTAEGVETEEELHVIRALGCSKIQGYYFGRPMPFSDTMELFENKGRKVA